MAVTIKTTSIESANWHKTCLTFTLSWCVHLTSTGLVLGKWEYWRKVTVYQWVVFYLSFDILFFLSFAKTERVFFFKPVYNNTWRQLWIKGKQWEACLCNALLVTNSYTHTIQLSIAFILKLPSGESWDLSKIKGLFFLTFQHTERK